jgi:tetratricopeptide (TPR) repeat protein
MQKQFIPALLGIGIATPFTGIAPAIALPASPTVSSMLSPKDYANNRIVSIETRSGQGSGVIIKRSGDTYTILTAAHVVNDLKDSPVAIITPDRQQHTANPREVKIAPNSLDLATITFHSQQDYLVAELGDSNTIDKGQHVFAAGFQGKSLKFYPGTVVAISRQSQDLGYGLAIGSADILPGMSGGGLFNQTGTLIGINGKSIGTIDKYSNQSNHRNFKPVSGLAIPINTFTNIASQLNVAIDNTPPVTTTSDLTADDFFITAGSKSQKGSYRGAIADYDRALALNPQFEEIYFRRGIAHSLVKNWQAAESDYNRAIEIKPEHVEAYLHRGSMRNIRSNWRGAKSDFDVALTLNPNSLSAYIGRGIALCELNDCQSGLKDYQRAIGIDRSSAEAHARRAFAYYRLGNRQKAIDSYMTAADLYQQQGKDGEYLDAVKKIKQLLN